MDSLVSNDEVVVGKRGKLNLNQRFDPNNEPNASLDEAGTECSSRMISSEYFVERESVLQIINEVFATGTDGTGNAKDFRIKLRHVVSAIERYRDDPSLIDPHVVDIVRPILQNLLLPRVKQPGKPEWDIIESMGCSLVYVVSTVVGYKTLTRVDMFPHDVFLLDPVLTYCEYLEAFPDQWESRFVMYLWLSVLVMCPFSFESIGIAGLRERLVKSASLSHMSNKALVKASTLFAARLYSRSDDLNFSLFKDYIASGVEESPFLETVHKTLSMVSRMRAEEDLLSKIIDLVVNNVFSSEKTFVMTVRDKQLIVGICASVACVSCPIDNVDRIEKCIDRIFSFLNDKESMVRTSVAKAVGRVCGSLPAIYRDQLVKYILNEINPNSDFETHSCCLIQGELTRRGLIITTEFRDTVIETSIDALEKERNSVALSQQIRDSGCAIVWSLARMHCDERLLESSLPPLINLALFEKDINLRRSAAAAIQEVVGRVGTEKFQTGLILVDLIDFWSIASVTYTYLELPSQLVTTARETDEEWSNKIFNSLLKHLLDEKLFKLKFVKQISLAASGLARLFSLRASETAHSLLGICAKAIDASSGWTERYACVETVTEFVQVSQNLDPQQFQSAVRNLVPNLEKKRMYKGKGGDMIRQAAYRLVGGIFANRSKFEFKDKSKFIGRMSDILCEGCVHLNDQVQIAAVIAFNQLCNSLEDNEFSAIHELVIDKFTSQLTQEVCVNICARRGMIFVLSSIIPLRNVSANILGILCKESVAWPKHYISQELVDPVSRKFALFGLIRYSLLAEPGDQAKILECILECLEDFHSDKRGDVGSWVREIALDGLALLVGAGRVSGDKIKKVIQCIVAHTGERLDRIRNHASSTLNDIRKKEFPTMDEIFAKFTGIPTAQLFESDTFLSVPTCIEFNLTIGERGPFESLFDLIGTAPDPTCLLIHFINSVGGVTSSALSHSAESALISFFETNVDASSRVIVPVMSFLALKCRKIKFQATSDRINRIFIPAVNTLSLLAEYLSDNDVALIDVHIRNNVMKFPCTPILTVNRLKTIAKLYSKLFLRSNHYIREFIVSDILLSNIPVLRQTFVSASLVFLASSPHSSAEELSDVLDSANWMSEKQTDWDFAVHQFAAKFDIKIESCTISVSSSVKGPSAIPAYAEFVNEVHRFR